MASLKSPPPVVGTDSHTDSVSRPSACFSIRSALRSPLLVQRKREGRATHPVCPSGRMRELWSTAAAAAIPVVGATVRPLAIACARAPVALPPKIVILPPPAPSRRCSARMMCVRIQGCPKLLGKVTTNVLCLTTVLPYLVSTGAVSFQYRALQRSSFAVTEKQRRLGRSVS